MSIETFIRDTCLMAGIAAFSVLFAELSGVAQWLKGVIPAYSKSETEVKEILMPERGSYFVRAKVRVPRKRLKPLDCPMCLAWWIGIAYGCIFITWWAIPLYAAACSILAIFISRNLRY